MIQELTKKSWCENVDTAGDLAVVFFYAKWCRNCKAVEPVLRRMEREFEDASFFKVNFKAETELCYNERVFSFPTVHFYLPGIGRVGRLVLTAKEAEPRLRVALGRFLSGSEGAPPQLQLLKELRAEVLSPIVRYTDLVSALQGLANRQALEEAGVNPNMAGLQQQIEADEARLDELEALFAMLDRDEDGRLTVEELEAGVQALRPKEWPGPGADVEGVAAPSMLLSRIRAAPASSVDLATFVRLMTTKAVREYTKPDMELLPAFEALDLDGDGCISREEMLATIENFCMALPEADGCDVDQRAVLPLAFDAFANDEELIDYERFVELVSGRNQPLECELDSEESYSAMDLF